MVACSGSAVSDRRARLPGSPKRELREYVLLHRKLNRIPSARASGFKASRRAFSIRRSRPSKARQDAEALGACHIP